MSSALTHLGPRRVTRSKSSTVPALPAVSFDLATLENILSHAGPSSLQFTNLPSNLFSGSSVNTVDSSSPSPPSGFPYPHGSHPRARSHATPASDFSAQEAFSQALSGLLQYEGLADQSMAGPATPGLGGLMSNVPAFDFGQPTTAYSLSNPPPAHQSDHSPTTYGMMAQSPPRWPLPPDVPAPTDPVSLSNPVNLASVFDTFPPMASTPEQVVSWPTPPAPGSIDGPFVLPTTWDEHTTLSIELRAHLLGIFQQRMRQFVLAIDFGRFLRRLDGPVAEQPAPALVFAIYANAAGFSPRGEVRVLADRLVEVAQKHIALALRDMSVDLLGALQASNLIGFLLYSRGSYGE